MSKGRSYELTRRQLQGPRVLEEELANNDLDVKQVVDRLAEFVDNAMIKLRRDFKMDSNKTKEYQQGTVKPWAKSK